MPTFEAGYNGGRPFKLSLTINLVSQSVANNTSTISWSLNIIKTGTSPSWSNNSSSWNLNINGNTRSGSFTYDFRSADSKNLGSGTIVINHNSDGSKSFGATASSSADALGSASLSGNTTLPTIDRASEPTFRNGSTFFAGDSVIIDMNRSSTSFTHVVTYNFGGITGTIDSSAEGSATWTPPLSLLSKIPNNTSGTGNVSVKTMSGGSSVGTTSVGFTLKAPGSVVPSFSTITSSETNSQVASLVGAYTQLLSTLQLQITGATGIYGSSISSYKITVDGQTINGSIGTTAPISSSGTVTITGTITDSRGRTAAKSVNINVLPYSPPQLNAVTSKRATSGGAISDQGTFIRASINASVTSLAPGGTQKNALRYRVSTRQAGTSTWTVGPIVTPGGISYNAYQLAPSGGIYTVDNSYDVRIEVFDVFATSTIIQTVPTAVIFMHWDSKLGVGFGKFRENGTVDAIGDIYHRNGKIVEPVGMMVMFAALSAPAGWLVCNGSAVSRTTYADLFAVIGTTWGAGDGSTTFNIPDMRTRAPFGYSSGSSGFDSLNNSGGATSHAKTFANGTAYALFDIATANMYINRVSGISSWTAGNGSTSASWGGDASARTNGTRVAGATDSTNDMPPYLIVNFIIKA